MAEFRGVELGLERILADERKLREWHQPRVDHLALTRLIRDLSEQTSVPMDERTMMITKEVSKIVTARPYLTWMWALGSLAAEPFRYRNPYSAEAQKERLPGKKPIEEYLAYGISAQVDALRAHRGNAVLRRTEMAWQVLSGSYAWRPLIHEKDGKLIFDVEFYDPASVYWLPGQLGLQIAVRSFQTTLLDAALYVERYGGRLAKVTGKETDNVKCIEHWVLQDDKVYSAFSVSAWNVSPGEALGKTDLALPFEEHERLKQIPLMCGCVNSPGSELLPSSWGAQSGGQQFIQAFGRSILAPMIRAVQQSNLFASLALLVARDAIVPAEISTTHGGAGVDNTARLGEKVQIDLRVGEEFRYEPKPTPGWDMKGMGPQLMRELDEAGASPTVLGDLTPMPSSGFLAETARFNTEVVKLSPFGEPLRLLEQETMMALIRLFKEEKGEVHLEGRHLEQMGVDGHFARDFKPAELQKGYWEIVVEHKVARPMDDAAVFNVANSRYMARFISRRQAQEEAGVMDPEGEDEQRMREEIADSPTWVMRRQVNALEDLMLQARAAGNEEDAAEYEREFFVADRNRAAMLAGATAQNAQAQPGLMAPQPNAPIEAPSPPPAIQPPEARGEGREQKKLAAFSMSRNGGK